MTHPTHQQPKKPICELCKSEKLLSKKGNWYCPQCIKEEWDESAADYMEIGNDLI